ncbi:phosphatidylserine decarboxylase 1, partial [Spiromyces aspiralis]
LKEGARPIYSDEHDENEGLLSSPTLTSPSDGRILHFGVIEQRQVEQVKGLTYDLDSFFGLESHRLDTDTDGRDIGNEEGLSRQTIEIAGASHSDYAVGDHEFANVNGITYSIDSLLNGDPSMTQPHSDNETEDSGNNSRPVTAVSALKDLGTRLGPNHRLFFCVIYLAPGDYHRFHSPANWVVEGRRHFAGELYSVSPYIASILPNLFVLNERVALLGRWRYGFMSMVPVGATNVGSIYINFDK